MSCTIPEHAEFRNLIATVKKQSAQLEKQIAQLEKLGTQLETQGAQLKTQGAQLGGLVCNNHRIVLRQALADAETLLMKLCYCGVPLEPTFYAQRHIFSIDDAFRWASFHVDDPICSAIVAAAKAAKMIADSVAPMTGRSSVRKAALYAAHPADLHLYPADELESYAESAYPVAVAGGVASCKDGRLAVRLYRHASWLSEQLAASGVGAGSSAFSASITRLHASKLREYTVMDSDEDAALPGAGTILEGCAAPPFKELPKRVQKKKADAKPAEQELRVMTADPSSLPVSLTALTPGQLKHRGLVKRLRYIEQLEARVAAGEEATLDAGQCMKVAAGAEVRAALAALGP